MSAVNSTESRTLQSDRGLTPGQRVRNLFSGETLTFRRTSGDSAAELIELELDLRLLGAPGGMPHRHVPAERFELMQGTLLVWIAGQRPWVARPGDVIEVPSNRWHFMLAMSPSRAEVSVRPGMHFDELLARLAEIGSGDLRPSTILRVIPLLREHGFL